MGSDPYTVVAETSGPYRVRRSDNLRAMVHGDVLARIRSGGVDAEARLVDVEIAARLGVSRMPVREALMQLVSEGYLVGTTRGFMRPRLTRADVAEIFEVRRLLEPRAAAHAARDLDEAGRARLRTALAAAERAAEAGDDDALFKANVAFRDGWIAAVSNQRLTSAIQRFVDHVQVVRLATLRDLATQPMVVDGLRRIFEAFERGDSVAAEAAMGRFIDAAEERFAVLGRIDGDGPIDLPGGIAAGGER